MRKKRLKLKVVKIIFLVLEGRQRVGGNQQGQRFRRRWRRFGFGWLGNNEKLIRWKILKGLLDAQRPANRKSFDDCCIPNPKVNDRIVCRGITLARVEIASLDTDLRLNRDLGANPVTVSLPTFQTNFYQVTGFRLVAVETNRILQRRYREVEITIAIKIGYGRAIADPVEIEPPFSPNRCKTEIT